ncbi:hypothetical protein AMS68_001547 [Peltaster fructicola]|uniref:MOSC domain-containing protein n=1 Tax=Peltaster fructicola TaxID=286661 RepID=A0A6H0XNG6_9PEZI|nr:hypothetical protein AMS68_001547 [Peltaster fructicola]
MKVAQLYTYPIKSLRPHALQEAELTRHGFQYDRRFMLLQALRHDDGTVTYKNMHVSHYPQMVLFHTELHTPSSSNARDGSISVTYKPPNGASACVVVPLEPDFQCLSPLEVEMHKSSTTAFDMGGTFNNWFSARFGFDVVLAYLGDQHRAVRMSTSPRMASTWLSYLSDAATSLLHSRTEDNDEQITFADCAPYLVVSERSMDDVHRRLPEGQSMDITKFRPNVIVSGAEQPWEEDFWGEITVGQATKIECVHNCVRCASINIDFATGKPGVDETGKMLSKLQKDRRVDIGSKYSPVFGRYSFLHKSSVGDRIRIGDEVRVTKLNQERTVFDWEGL